MMARRTIFGLLTAGAGVLLWGCDVNSPTMGFIWQQPYYPKLKVEVETPEGIKSGYSVIEVKWDKAGRGFNVQGEAVAVDLPGGQTLFVLLRSEGSVDWAAYLHQIVKLDNSPEDQTLYYRRIAANRQIWSVPRKKSTFSNRDFHDNYPYFVRFKDIRDPKSVEQVDPEQLDTSFGEGVKLKNLTVQMTDAQVTGGIEKRLGWLKGMQNNLDGSRLYDLNANLSARLNSGDFRRESSGDTTSEFRGHYTN